MTIHNLPYRISRNAHARIPYDTPECQVGITLSNVKPTRRGSPYPQCQADTPHRYLIVIKFSGTTPNLAEWQARVNSRYLIVTKFLGSGRKLPHEASPPQQGPPTRSGDPVGVPHKRSYTPWTDIGHQVIVSRTVIRQTLDTPTHHSTPSSLSHASTNNTNTPTAIRFSPRLVGRMPLMRSPPFCPNNSPGKESARYPVGR